MRDHPKDVGDRSTLAIMLALSQAGYTVLLPFGENTRYDLVIDDGASLARVQCKTGRLRQGAVTFATCSSYAHHPNPKMIARSYRGEIDLFAVYCAAIGGVYLVPAENVALGRRASLRVFPPQNNQFNRVRFAADYEIAQVDCTVFVTARPGVTAGASAPSA
jgi:hypothetical protein